MNCHINHEVPIGIYIRFKGYATEATHTPHTHTYMQTLLVMRLNVNLRFWEKKIPEYKAPIESSSSTQRHSHATLQKMRNAMSDFRQMRVRIQDEDNIEKSVRMDWSTCRVFSFCIFWQWGMSGRFVDRWSGRTRGSAITTFSIIRIMTNGYSRRSSMYCVGVIFRQSIISEPAFRVLLGCDCISFL